MSRRGPGLYGFRKWLLELPVGVPTQVPAEFIGGRMSNAATTRLVVFMNRAYGPGIGHSKRWFDGSHWILRAEAVNE